MIKNSKKQGENKFKFPIFKCLISKNEDIFALFDVDKNVRAICYEKEPLIKLRKKLKWGDECKIRLVNFFWVIKK